MNHASVVMWPSLLATLRLPGRQGREPCWIALWDCFGGHIFIIACAEQELKSQESRIPGVEPPKPTEYCTMAILKRWLQACQGAKLSGKRKELIKRSVRMWYIRRLLSNNASSKDLIRRILLSYKNIRKSFYLQSKRQHKQWFVPKQSHNAIQWWDSRPCLSHNLKVANTKGTKKRR